MKKALESLNLHLFALTSRHLAQDQKDFLASQWEMVRHYGCQNAGLKRWGNHLLKIGPRLHNRLDQTFSHLLVGIEMKGFKIWKEVADDPHLEKLLQLWLDDRVKLADANFSLKERLAFFLEYDPAIVAQYRKRYEQIFTDLYHQMVWTQHDPFVIQMLIGNLTGLYPLFDPPEHHEVKLLEYRDHTWHLIRYRCETVPMVKDQFLAYGLKPVDSPHSDPLLLFCPTPYPAAQGFWEAIKSDLHPFYSIGESLFRQGSDAIDRWIQPQKHVQCYGVSLGGALAYHLGRKYGAQVTIHAYVAPGLTLKHFRNVDIDGSVFYHVNDFVAHLGFHPSGLHFKSYAVITAASRNFVLAHTRPAGCTPTLVLEINPFYDNQRLSRRLLTVIKPWVGLLLYVVLFPLRLIGRIYRLMTRR